MSDGPRHKWFKPHQDVSGNPSDLGESVGFVEPRRERRAQILRGPFEVQGSVTPRAARAEGRDQAGQTGRPSVEGRIDVEELEQAVVRLAYNPSEYGVVKAETLEEREERHQRELAELRQEMEQREQAAYQRGLEEGKQAGHDAGVEEVREHFEAEAARVSAFLNSLSEATRSYFDGVEVRFVNLAMNIARRIVGDAAEQHRDIAVRLASEAIRLATERSRITVHCNPRDLDTFKQAKGQLRAISEGIKVIEFETNDRIEPGGVILETQGGSIDATIETMLDEVHKALLPDYDDPTARGEGGEGHG